MTDPIDTARAEGIALGLAMVKAVPRFVPSQSWVAGKPFREAVWADAIPDPPIPPHVAAARVLLDDLRLALASDRPPEGSASGLRWSKAHDAAESAPTSMSRPTPIQMIRAALEQIAKEGE
mgnify:FL=1